MENRRKNPKIDLERKKTLFFETGLIVVLFMVMVAFQWETQTGTGEVNYKRAIDNTPEEWVEVTVQKEKRRPPVPKPVVKINIVPDDMEPDVDPDIDAGTFDDDPVDYGDYQVEDEAEIPETLPFIKVERKPEFPGGTQALFKFLAENIVYPETAKEAGIQGTVYINFVIDTDGSVTGVKVLRGLPGGLTEEAVRVVKSLPRWKPGLQAGKPVRVTFTLPVKFTLL